MIAKRPPDTAPLEERLQYHKLPNIEKYGPGPWADEPNRELWKAHGLDCLINRNHAGAWCGYVAVPSTHPFYDKSYQDLYDHPKCPEVHGGLTYSDICQGEICHPHDEGDLPVKWFGFDCAHAYDLVPGLPRFAGIKEIYRDLAYVKDQTERLAQQLAEVGNENNPES